ncbi:helix-turn-helix domain-containing protein [Malaciobacter mytili]|uniref:helix-turn-helix domain-containing protein n=1 Tax=Malaciobacter mytili TaxID=603050 RepID=UPI003A83A385
MKNQIKLEKLGKVIKKLRLEQKISQEELANRCEFDRTYISMLERGKRNPSYLNLLKLCAGLQIEIHLFVEKINKND